jgi:hypothetical protein
MLLPNIRSLGCHLSRHSSLHSSAYRIIAANNFKPRGTARQVTCGVLFHSSRASTRFCSTIALMASSKPFADKAPEEYRLPLDVKPTHYDVTLRTDLNSLTFDGFVKIEYVAFILMIDLALNANTAWISSRKHPKSHLILRI